MRKVKVFKYNALNRGDRLDDGEAMFHQWGVDFEEYETGAGNFTTAIIERKDGSIECPPADMIEFLES